MNQKVRRRVILLSCLVGITGGSLLAAENVEAYRRWRGDTYAFIRQGRSYRDAIALGSRRADRAHRRRRVQVEAYNPVSFERVTGAARSRVMGDVTVAALQGTRSSGVSVRRAQPGAIDYSRVRSRGGVLTEQQVYAFRDEFAEGQSRGAVRSALGDPVEHTPNRDVYRIQRIGLDGRPSGEFGTIEFDYSGLGWDSTNPYPKVKW